MNKKELNKKINEKYLFTNMWVTLYFKNDKTNSVNRIERQTSYHKGERSCNEVYLLSLGDIMEHLYFEFSDYNITIIDIDTEEKDVFM